MLVVKCILKHGRERVAFKWEEGDCYKGGLGGRLCLGLRVG